MSDIWVIPPNDAVRRVAVILCEAADTYNPTQQQLDAAEEIARAVLKELGWYSVTLRERIGRLVEAVDSDYYTDHGTDELRSAVRALREML